MNEFNFNIRLSMHPDADLPSLFVDELPIENRVGIISHLSGEYDWLDKTVGEAKGSKEYIIRQKIMAQHGFTNDDIIMLAEYQDDGKLHVTIMSDKDFNEVREVHRHNNTSIKRTLIECAKNSINGALSDGIGENEVGRCCYQGINYDVWLDELETTAETEGHGAYFKIKDYE